MKPQAWTEIPADEVERLAGLLDGYLKRAGVAVAGRGLKRCRVETRRILDQQGWHCAFSGGSHLHCWNGKLDAKKPHIALRWGHRTPQGRKQATGFDDYFLLCERCNNQLQTSRTLEELRDELVHKLAAIEKLIVA